MEKGRNLDRDSIGWAFCRLPIAEALTTMEQSSAVIDWLLTVLCQQPFSKLCHRMQKHSTAADKPHYTHRGMGGKWVSREKTEGQNWARSGRNRYEKAVGADGFSGNGAYRILLKPPPHSLCFLRHAPAAELMQDWGDPLWSRRLIEGEGNPQKKPPQKTPNLPLLLDTVCSFSTRLHQWRGRIWLCYSALEWTNKLHFPHHLSCPEDSVEGRLAFCFAAEFAAIQKQQ